MRMQANFGQCALHPACHRAPYEDLPTNACPKTRSIGQPGSFFARPLSWAPRTAKESSKPFIAATNQVASNFSWTRVEPIEWTPVRWMPNWRGRPDSDGGRSTSTPGANSSGIAGRYGARISRSFCISVADKFERSSDARRCTSAPRSPRSPSRSATRLNPTLATLLASA